jgi:subtilisin family serine protease
MNESRPDPNQSGIERQLDAEEAALARPADADGPEGDPHATRHAGRRSIEDSRIVDVQFDRTSLDLAEKLARDMDEFMGEEGPVPPPAGQRRVANVLLRYHAQASASSFSPEHIQAEIDEMASGDMPEAVASLPPLQSFVRLWFPSAEEAAAAARELDALPDVDRAQVVPWLAPPQTPVPQDPFIGTAAMGVTHVPGTPYQHQWYLHRTSVPGAWALGARGAGVVIADIDWGYLTTHQELMSRLEMARAYNSADRTNKVSQGQDVDHGTAVMGLVGAAAEGRGMAGYAPEADLWPVQGNSDSVGASYDHWADGILYATAQPSGGRRKVILVELETRSMSGNCEQRLVVNTAIRRAIARNMVVCVPAGNGGREAHLADNGVTAITATGSILVGATRWHDTIDQRDEDSNWGPWIVVSAPGDSDYDVTCSNAANDAYRNRFGGTSGAAAKVAGVAALMLSVNPALTHDQVREILRCTGTPIVPESSAPHKFVGKMLNAAAAVKAAIALGPGPSAGSPPS